VSVGYVFGESSLVETFFSSGVEPHNCSLDIMSYPHVPWEKGPCMQIPSDDKTEELTEEQEVKIFAKQMLINRLFLGHYKERRFVESLGSDR
jgi:hypothetical protein